MDFAGDGYTHIHTMTRHIRMSCSPVAATGSQLSLNSDGLCTTGDLTELIGNAVFLHRSVDSVHPPQINSWWRQGQSSDEFCPHQSSSCMVSHGLHVHVKLLYIHIFAGGCHWTAMEASATETACGHGMGQGPGQHGWGQIVHLEMQQLLLWPRCGSVGGSH